MWTLCGLSVDVRVSKNSQKKLSAEIVWTLCGLCVDYVWTLELYNLMKKSISAVFFVAYEPLLTVKGLRGQS